MRELASSLRRSTRFVRSGRPRSSEVERRVAHVIRIADRLFVTQGYAETSLIEIARGARVSGRTIRDHLGLKPDLLRWVVEERLAKLDAEFPDIGLTETLSVSLKSAAEAARRFAFARSQFELWRLVISQSESRPELLQSVAARCKKKVEDGMEGVFQQLAARGIIPSANLEASARIFLDLVVGRDLGHEWGRKSDDAEVDVMTAKINLFIKGRLAPEVTVGR